MSEKREQTRQKKRLSIRFGTGEAGRVAFSEDISLTGMFIKTPNVAPPNTKIVVEFNLEGHGKVMVEARVVWAKKVPQNLFHLAKKCGMGIRFLRFHEGEQQYLSYCQEQAALRNS